MLLCVWLVVALIPTHTVVTMVEAKEVRTGTYRLRGRNGARRMRQLRSVSEFRNCIPFLRFNKSTARGWDVAVKKTNKKKSVDISGTGSSSNTVEGNRESDQFVTAPQRTKGNRRPASEWAPFSYQTIVVHGVGYIQFGRIEQ